MDPIGPLAILILAVIVLGGGAFAAIWFFMAGKDRDQE